MVPSGLDHTELGWHRIMQPDALGEGAMMVVVKAKKRLWTLGRDSFNLFCGSDASLSEDVFVFKEFAYRSIKWLSEEALTESSERIDGLKRKKYFMEAAVGKNECLVGFINLIGIFGLMLFSQERHAFSNKRMEFTPKPNHREKRRRKNLFIFSSYFWIFSCFISFHVCDYQLFLLKRTVKLID